MRYTTVIDISEEREVYTNHNARLVYLHLCLKAGYEDSNRDYCRCSIRTLAADVGITVAAVRHALHVLAKAALVERRDGGYMVAKFVLDKHITKRPRTKRQQHEQEEARQRELNMEAQQREAEERRRNAVSPAELAARGIKFTGALAALNNK